MSKREKDFDTQSDKYVEMRKSFGVNDPYALKEIGEAHYQGAEHGYQYAVDMIAKHLLCIELSNFFPTLDEDAEIAKGREKLIEFIRKAMEE